MKTIGILFLLGVLVSCASKKSSAIIYQPTMLNSALACSSHGGLSYIIKTQTITNVYSELKPCEFEYVSKCVDGTTISNKSEGKYCFESELDFKRSLRIE